MDEAKIERAIRDSWQAIAEEDLQVEDLDEAVELACDADRPVTFGKMTREEYVEFTALGWDEVLRIGRKALKGYF